MLIHNITGMVYACRVTHKPTGTRFSVVVTLEDEGRKPAFALAVHALAGVDVRHDGAWRAARVGADEMRVKVAYDVNYHRHRRGLDWLPTMYLIGDRAAFEYRFERLVRHPLLESDGTRNPRAGVGSA
jgi:hypothetical protein